MTIAYYDSLHGGVGSIHGVNVIAHRTHCIVCGLLHRPFARKCTCRRRTRQQQREPMDETWMTATTRRHCFSSSSCSCPSTTGLPRYARPYMRVCTVLIYLFRLRRFCLPNGRLESITLQTLLLMMCISISFPFACGSFAIEDNDPLSADDSSNTYLYL